jgi:Na+-driven multidrug efflux pump
MLFARHSHNLRNINKLPSPVIEYRVMLNQKKEQRLSIAEWISSSCAVAGVFLAAYNLEPERRARLRESVRAVTSKIITVALYLPLLLIVVVFGSEIVDFSRSAAPIERFEIINLILNFIAVGAAVWSGVYLYGNLGRGTKQDA